ncbi:hypothetical protein VNI00_010699 [Paramarasmius palmivorus]|uniref:BTB domain-containing protein n=1 Tax=Paramarasmius palmivorus TaxID=297713 RepID=A0AAW0CIE5_9AGAR
MEFFDIDGPGAMDALRGLREDPDSYDVILVVEGTPQLACHSLLLCATSPAFADAFLSGFQQHRADWDYCEAVVEMASVETVSTAIDLLYHLDNPQELLCSILQPIVTGTIESAFNALRDIMNVLDFVAEWEMDRLKTSIESAVIRYLPLLFPYLDTSEHLVLDM